MIRSITIAVVVRLGSMIRRRRCMISRCIVGRCRCLICRWFVAGFVAGFRSFVVVVMVMSMGSVVLIGGRVVGGGTIG